MDCRDIVPGEGRWDLVCDFGDSLMWITHRRRDDAVSEDFPGIGKCGATGKVFKGTHFADSSRRKVDRLPGAVMGLLRSMSYFVQLDISTKTLIVAGTEYDLVNDDSLRIEVPDSNTPAGKEIAVTIRAKLRNPPRSPSK